MGIIGQVMFTLPMAPQGYRFRADKNGTQFWSGADTVGHVIILNRG